jgi:hypothetical protein
VELADLVASRSRSSINATTLQRAVKLWESTADAEVDDTDDEDEDTAKPGSSGDPPEPEASEEHQKLLKKQKRRHVKVAAPDDVLTPVMMSYLLNIVNQNKAPPPIVTFGADAANMDGLDNLKVGFWLPVSHSGFWAPDKVFVPSITRASS